MVLTVFWSDWYATSDTEFFFFFFFNFMKNRSVILGKPEEIWERFYRNNNVKITEILKMQ